MPKNCINCFAPMDQSGVCPQCGFNNAVYQPKPHHLPPGTALRGRYIIGKVLGEGGFGITYAGYDPVLSRRVAVKEYYPSGAVWREPERSLNVNCPTSGSFAETFRIGREKCMQEAKSLASLDDVPAIVRVIDFFEENNTAYILMEFIEGVTLREFMRKQPKRMTLTELLTLLAPVTDALEKIHKRGFVHRDVSPDNIMITRDGAAKLLDFGAVKHMSNTDGTMTQNPIVKRGFSPLELYSTSGVIGPWTDVYAFAATLFYLLTGSPLDEPADRFDNDTAPDKLRGVLPPAQAEALLRGLSMQRGARQQTVSALVHDLTAGKSRPAPVKAAEKADESRTIPLVPEEPEDDIGETIPLADDEQAKAAHNDAIYQKATAMMSDTSVAKNEETILLFTSIIDWKDSREKIDECKKKIEVIKQAKEEKKEESTETLEKAEPKKRKPLNTKLLKKAAMIVVPVVAVLVVLAIVLNTIVFPSIHLKKAVAAEKSGDTVTAMLEYGKAKHYKDAAEKAREYALPYQKSITGLIAAGFSHTVGLKADGTVVATGENIDGRCDVDGWTDVVAVAAGEDRTVGLKADGTVVATKITIPNFDDGQCDVDSWTDITAIAAGGYHTVGLKADGTVVATGRRDWGQCDVDSWTDIVAISAGRYQTIGLKANGTVVVTPFRGEDNHHGSHDKANGWKNIVAISAGDYNTIGLRADGTVVATAEYFEKFTKDWKDIVAIAMGSDHTVGLKADGTVIATGDNYNGQCNVDGWTDIVAIAAGNWHTVGLKADGAVVATEITDSDYDTDQCDVDGWNNMMLPKDRT